MSDECDPSTYTQHTSEWTENTARYFKLVLKPPTAPQSDNITRLYYFAALLQKIPQHLLYGHQLLRMRSEPHPFLISRFENGSHNYWCVKLEYHIDRAIGQKRCCVYHGGRGNFIFLKRVCKQFFCIISMFDIYIIYIYIYIIIYTFFTETFPKYIHKLCRIKFS